MATLLELQTRIEALPERRRRAELVCHLRKYTELLAAAAEEVDGLRGARNLVAARIDASVLATIDGSVASATGAARRLRRRLEKDLAEITKSSSEDDVFKIRDNVHKASGLLLEAWHGAVTQLVTKVQPVVEAVAASGLDAGKDMRVQLRALEGHAARLPNNEAEVAAVFGAHRRILERLADLDLAGEVLEFFMAAVGGNADPRYLERPAVRNWLDRLRLWGLLKVRLG